MSETIAIVVLFLLGTASHFLKDMIRIKGESGRRISIKQYWGKYPLQNTLYVITAIACLIIVYYTNMLNPAAAFFIGISANSVADSLGKRQLERME